MVMVKEKGIPAVVFKESVCNECVFMRLVLPVVLLTVCSVCGDVQDVNLDLHCCVWLFELDLV